jgi:CRP/FNR family transcriptional regulator, cyclic AMP receptor protein
VLGGERPAGALPQVPGSAFCSRDRALDSAVVALRKDAKVEIIRRVPLFAQCSKRELTEVASIADEIDIPAGKELIREGDRGREFFVLLEGSADVRVKGRRRSTMEAGDFFGEIALVADTPRTATVTSTSPGRALVITARAFRHLLERSPQIQLKVLQALAERLAPATL